MARTKTIFTCSNCGAQSPKWLGRCPSCGGWNTFVEEVIVKKKSPGESHSKESSNHPLTLEQINGEKFSGRISFGINEFDRVLGGGIVPGSIVLLGGEPGIGKSTLALQVALNLKERQVLYVSGEESLRQIKLRADRLGVQKSNTLFLCETSLELIINRAESIKPDLLVVDSVQTVSTELVESSPGSVSQVRECASALIDFAKNSGTAVILIGHINKEGTLAGPKVLEHMVDTVLQFEGDSNYMYRILRANKNRFGSTNELGIFEMRSEGLKEIENPSEQLLPSGNNVVSGTAVASAIQGIRPFLIEIQALVSTAAYGTPQRSSTGFDLRRLNMLLAVLEKRAGFRLLAKDVFINIAGGLKINDPATDLAVICAILSSNIDISTHHKTCFTGEVGLTGEIRAVSRIEQRISEASRLGFKKIIIPGLNKGFDISKFNIKIDKVDRVEEVVKLIFGKSGI
jgi:DNA repair protein RadA/Sms